MNASRRKRKTGLRAAGLTDQGLVRKRNEDAFSINKEIGLVLVSDGMGGRSGGARAASFAVKILPIMLAQAHEKLLKGGQREVSEGIKTLVADFNAQLVEHSNQRANVAGMGATLVFVWCLDGVAYVTSIGDSRVYRQRKAEFVRITHDHTIAELLLEEGVISRDEAAEHPGRSMLAKYIGMAGTAVADVQPIGLAKGDRYLLCSDGLTKELAETEISSVLSSGASPSQVVSILVQEAVARGGRDNVTAVVADWHG